MQDFIDACRHKKVRVRSHIVGQLTFHIKGEPVTLRQGEIRTLTTRYSVIDLKASNDLKRYIASGDIEVIPVS